MPVKSMKHLACFLAIAVLISVHMAFPVPVFAEPLDNINDPDEYTYNPEDSLTLAEVEDSSAMLLSEARSSDIQLIELGGVDRYGTVAQEARYAFPKTDRAIVASGVGYADSIAAAGLAGALDCPIILTPVDSVPQSVLELLQGMGVKDVVLLGSQSVASGTVENQLRSLVSGKVERVYGPDRYGTQLAIYQYGVRNGLWTADTAVVVSATGFADALSVSPVSYALKAPVFFCDDSGSLPQANRDAIEKLSSVRNFILVGSEAVTSSSTQAYLSSESSSRGGGTVRFGGPDRYNTSMEVAQYAVANLGFTWDGVAFASGLGPYDSLGGGVVQGKERSVILLADSVSSSSVDIIGRNGGKVETALKFFGSLNSISAATRTSICAKLGFPYYQNVRETIYPLSLAQMADYQVARGESQSWSAFYSALNPAQHSYGTAPFFQFAVLNAGYSGVPVSVLDSFIAANCSYSESVYGGVSTLRGAGSYFVEASQVYGVNEVYLLSHAIWESGWGCSDLARGWTPDHDGEVVVGGVRYPYKKGVTYYNYFGIGAVDSNALSGGRAMAVKEGWTSPRLAIFGAAKWISANYHNRAAGRQNTLYLMKWDVEGAIRSGSAWHEYCTGLDSWVLGISRIMANCYASAGYSPSTAPVRFDVPVYAG